MHSKYYCLGDTVFCLRCDEPLSDVPYLQLFAVDPASADVTITLHRAPADAEAHRQHSAAWEWEVWQPLAPEYPLSARRALEEAGLFELLLQHGSLILHASHIRVGDKAIVFTAPCGVGKSTQAELWRQHRGAQIINGDRTLLQLTADSALACGVHYCGTSHICRNSRAPLQAVAVLGQAPQTCIRRLSGREAFRALIAQCSYDPKEPAQVAALSWLLADLLQRVPAYRLDCTPDLSAIEVLEEAMKE